MPPGRGAKARLRDPQQARTLCPACPSLPSWTLVQALYSWRGSRGE
jgi:formate dehydrogenase maturation protein FdhE